MISETRASSQAEPGDLPFCKPAFILSLAKPHAVALQIP